MKRTAPTRDDSMTVRCPGVPSTEEILALHGKEAPKLRWFHPLYFIGALLIGTAIVYGFMFGF